MDLTNISEREFFDSTGILEVLLMPSMLPVSTNTAVVSFI